MTDFADDDTIASDDILLRRVPNWPDHIADGGTRPSSLALELKDGEDGCSVHVQGRLVDPSNPLSPLDGHDERWGMAKTTAEAARTRNHDVAGDALPNDPAHALIVPREEGRKARKRNFRELAKVMTWVKEPELPPPPAGA